MLSVITKSWQQSTNLESYVRYHRCKLKTKNVFFLDHFVRPRLVPKVTGIERTKEELNRNEPARVPIDNEIPDSVNVQANLAPGANVPGAVENEHESRQQLNLGKSTNNVTILRERGYQRFCDDSTEALVRKNLLLINILISPRESRLF